MNGAMVVVCPSNQWSAEHFHDLVDCAAAFELARLTINGADVRADGSTVKAAYQMAWLENALPAGCA